MPTLAVRPISPRDLPALRHVSDRNYRLELPGVSYSVLPELASQVLATVPVDLHGEKIIVATVDNELCALVSLRPQTNRYRWNVVEVAAGSPRLDSTDDVCVELWTALLEEAVRHAGTDGARRLFAAAADEGPAYRSLRASGFERYATVFVVTGTGFQPDVDDVHGLREQDEGDVWAIHQLYDAVTPRAVQYAEALTSSAWELHRHRLVDWLALGRHRVRGYVLELRDGIVAYCQIRPRRGDVLIQVMVAPEWRQLAVPVVARAVRDAQVDSQALMRIVIPGYMRELIHPFEASGFWIESERTAMVRHTTVPVIVHSKLMPIAVSDSRERAPKGVPSYIRGTSVASRSVEI